MTFNTVFSIAVVLIMLFGVVVLILTAPGAKHPKNTHTK